MQYRDCPVCGAVEALGITWLSDGDGDGVYSRSWDYPEIVSTDCGCVIPDDDANRILDEIAKDGPPDD